jgi:hypothetical protein
MITPNSGGTADHDAIDGILVTHVEAEQNFMITFLMPIEPASQERRIT